MALSSLKWSIFVFWNFFRSFEGCCKEQKHRCCCRINDTSPKDKCFGARKIFNMWLKRNGINNKKVQKWNNFMTSKAIFLCFGFSHKCDTNPKQISSDKILRNSLPFLETRKFEQNVSLGKIVKFKQYFVKNWLMEMHSLTHIVYLMIKILWIFLHEKFFVIIIMVNLIQN